MLSATLTESLAQELHDARERTITIPQLSVRYPELDIAAAYAIQRALVSHMLADGSRVVGRKIGLTSKVMQRAMDIDEPDFGVITDDMQFADGGEVVASRFNYPRVEIELAFVLADSLSGPAVTPADVLGATRYIAPAIEILDSRVEMEDASGHRRTIVDTVADNAADAGLIVGSGRIDPAEYRPRSIGGELLINGTIEETGLDTAVLGNPALGVAWLANTLSAYGETLEAGSIILSGSFIRSVPVSPGDEVVGDFGDAGVVSCRFV